MAMSSKTITRAASSRFTRMGIGCLLSDEWQARVRRHYAPLIKFAIPFPEPLSRAVLSDETAARESKSQMQRRRGKSWVRQHFGHIQPQTFLPNQSVNRQGQRLEYYQCHQGLRLRKP